MFDIQKIIDLLEKAKHPHYTEPEGLWSCPALWTPYPQPCDCGADEINAEIDTMIVALEAYKKLPDYR